MRLSNRLLEVAAGPAGLLQGFRRACLIGGWDISGRIVARYYERLLRRHGQSSQALAERADDKDLAFYQHLFHGVDLKGPLSVLDIGCGMGDLIDFLQARQADIESYLGIDLVQQFVDICRQEYLPPCRFLRANFISPSFAPRERFNLIVNMGVMVSRVFHYEEYIAFSIEKMLALSSRHIVFNVITEANQSLGNYTDSNRIGGITALPRRRLAEIVARAASRARAEYTIREERIYPDSVDAFVHLEL